MRVDGYQLAKLAALLKAADVIASAQADVEPDSNKKLLEQALELWEQADGLANDANKAYAEAEKEQE